MIHDKPKLFGIFDDDGDVDIVVRDVTGQNGTLSLLDYALNLSPALRDTITRDVAQNVSAYEPRLRRKTQPPQPRSILGRSGPEQAPDPYDASLRKDSVQSKAAYLLGAPKAPK